MKKGSTPILKSKTKLVTCQLLLLVAIFLFWWLMTKPGLIPPFMFQDENQAAFFFGEPVQIGKVIWDWFAVNLEIYPNLAVTLTETVLAFIFGTAAGLLVGLWLALAPTAAAIADPYIKGLNSMPRVILAPIFGVWFGLGIGSKVALGITLVFFIVFFNVYQGVREVSPNVLASARMLGANKTQLLRCAPQGPPARRHAPSAAPNSPTSERDELGVFFAAFFRRYGLRRCGRRRILRFRKRCRLPDSAG